MKISYLFLYYLFIYNFVIANDELKINDLVLIASTLKRNNPYISVKKLYHLLITKKIFYDL